MRNQNCGCRRSNCPICCNRNRNAGGTGATGPTGAIGPTGPCCTGATGPAGPTEHRIVAGGRLSTSGDPNSPCDLILFAGSGVASMTAVQVAADGTRGYRIILEPQPCEDVFALVTVLGQLLFGPSPDLDLAQVPPTEPVIANVGFTNLGDGTCQLELTIYIMDTSTGLPVDPCCGTAFNQLWTFEVFVSGDQFFLANNLPPPAACTPPPGFAVGQTRKKPQLFIDLLNASLNKR